MFSKSSANNNNNTSYAFSQPAAVNSSTAVRKQENDTFYNPLPAPRSSQDQSRAQPSVTGQSANPFTDPRRDYVSRTPSPHASNPLLSSQLSDSSSPSSSQFHNSSNMPSASRYAPRAGTGMPQRGESQSALLGGNGQSSNARKYGPTASAAPIGASAALLSSPSQSSSDKAGINNQDGSAWGSGMDMMSPEADDYLHNPDPKRDRRGDHGGTIFTSRGLMNIGCLFILLLGVICLFAGYPIITFYTRHNLSTNGAYNLGGINSTGQVPLISNFPSPIDPDTPPEAYTRQGFDDGHTYNLVFSDEFNKDGRTFFPGDDPYWTAVDIHYWPTGDLEWYDPSAVTTKGGNLVITQTQEPIHDLNFKSGMLQSWNQMCFQYSVYFEVRLSLPGTPEVGGFWPGVWMMGNLGRPGYGATTEGTWPYTYDSCDVGTLANQTLADGSGPEAALTTGANGGPLSYLPGQRLSACTCAGEDHPGPDHTYGRASPEIDAIEAQIDLRLPRGELSQSNQIAPFDDYYQYKNGTNDVIRYDTTVTHWNTYLGGSYQQAVSGLTYIDNSEYELTNGAFGVHGFEYFSNPNDRNAGYITWLADGKKSWTMHASATGPNPVTGVGQRLVSEEPMAMIINFGASNNFQTVNLNQLTYPAHFLIDYVRVYQRPDVGKMGCDPADRPTADYIARHRPAYDNANFTTWAEAGYTFPKNSLIDKC